jgi:CBS domain-containing protein
MSPRAAWRLEQLGFAAVSEYTNGKSEWLGYGLPTEGAEAARPRAGDVVRCDVPTCRIDDGLETARERMRGSDWDLCIVVNESGVVLGRLRASKLDESAAGTAEAVMEPGPTTVRPDERLEELVERMRQAEVGQIIVTTPDGRLIGVLRRDEAETFLHHSLHHHHEYGHEQDSG